MTSWNVRINEGDIDMLMAQYRRNFEEMLAAKHVRARTPTPIPSPSPARARTPSLSPSPARTPPATTGCREMQTAKYKLPRKSPPYDAEMCRDEIRMGNDGKEYHSVRNDKGNWRWILVKVSPAAPAPKRPKSRSPPRAAAAAGPSIQVMTKAMIRESLAPYSARPRFEEFKDDLKMARRIFSPHVKYFTPKVIKQLKLKPGFTFWGLTGQDWALAADDDDDNRMVFLKQIKFQGFYNDETEQHLEEPHGDTSILYRAKYQEYDTMVIDGYYANECHDGKHWGTGSGCDPVMIFLSTF